MPTSWEHPKNITFLSACHLHWTDECRGTRQRTTPPAAHPQTTRFFQFCQRAILRWLPDVKVFHHWCLPLGRLSDIVSRRWRLWLAWAWCWGSCGPVWDGMTWPSNRLLLSEPHVQVDVPQPSNRHLLHSGSKVEALYYNNNKNALVA